MFGASGHILYHTNPNIQGGIDVVTNNGHQVLHTQPIAGGESILDSHGQQIGTMHHIVGGGSIDLNGQHASWQHNILGGNTIDPFSTVHSISFPPLI